VSSPLRKAASQQWGTVAPEDQKNIEDVLGNVPQPAQEGQGGADQGKPGQGAQKPPEGAQKTNPGGK
jgi:hypothetical protein